MQDWGWELGKQKGVVVMVKGLGGGKGESGFLFFSSNNIVLNIMTIKRE